MKKHPQVFLGVLFIVILVVIAGFAYWSKGKATPAVQKQNETLPLSQSIQPQSDSTDAWKTYRNARHGFTIRYSPEFSVLRSDSDRLQITSLQNTITISILDFRSSTATFQNWVNERPYALIKFEDRRALRWSTNDIEQFLVPSNDEDWAVAIDMVKSDSCASSNCVSIFDQMIHSLSFGGAN
jgi:hypothetical protein